MLPKLSGLEICREVRRDDSLNRLPILMLTARGEEADRVVVWRWALTTSDQAVQPSRLLARVKALLRRPSPPAIRPASSKLENWRSTPASYRVSIRKPVPA